MANPFSIRGKSVLDRPVSYYCRLRAVDGDVIIRFSDAHPDASSIPLDRFVVKGGSPDRSEGWLYAILSPDSYQEWVDQGMEGEILYEMALPEQGAETNGEDPLSRAIVTPNGRVEVYNEITKSYEGVAGVVVYMTQWFTTKAAETDANGYYRFSGSFDSFWGQPLVKVVFRNSKVNIRRFSFAPWDWVVPQEYIFGNKTVSSLNGLTLRFGDASTGITSISAKCALVMNVVRDYNAYAQEQCIRTLPTLKITMWDVGLGSTAGAACMFSYTTPGVLASIGTAAGAVASGGNPLAGLIGAMMGAGLGTQLPDILLPERNDRNSATTLLYTVGFHEFSHASHFIGLNSNGKSDLWWKEYQAVLFQAMDSEYYALCESWAEYSSNLALARKYSTTPIWSIGWYALYYNERNSNYSNYTSWANKFWNGALYDLNKIAGSWNRSEQWIDTNYRFSNSQLFSLFEGGTSSVRSFIDGLLAMNPTITRSYLTSLFSANSATIM